MERPTTRGNKPQSAMTASPEKYPQGYFKEKKCKECSKSYVPVSPSHLYCTDDCADIGHQRNWLRKNYKMTLEEYQKIFKDQNGKCAICQEIGFAMRENQRQLVVIDHCHSSGKVRGLLCHNCNRALGLFKDKINNLENAIRYLESATTIETTWKG
jgi:hypothetical protein